MQEHQAEYGLVAKNIPPYEVLVLRTGSPYDDVLRLKGIEEMVEVYYNSGQFTQTHCLSWKNILKIHLSCMQTWLHIMIRMDMFKINHKRAARYEILLEFVKEYAPEQMDVVREFLTYDYYLQGECR